MLPVLASISHPPSILADLGAPRSDFSVTFVEENSWWFALRVRWSLDVGRYGLTPARREKDAADWGGAHIDGGDDEELLFDTHHRRGYSGGVQRPAETVSD